MPHKTPVAFQDHPAVLEFHATYDIPMDQGDSYSFAEWYVSEKEAYGPVDALSEVDLESAWMEAEDLFDRNLARRRKAQG